MKIAKLQSYKLKYETLKMEDDERIGPFMTRVNDLVLGNRSFGGSLKEYEIVGNVLRSLPHAYKDKANVIEEIQTMTRDTSVSKLTTFELTEFVEQPIKTKTTFIDAISSKKKYDLGESSSRLSKYAKELEEMEREERELEQLEALIVRRVPKGVGKYEGKFPFKCFSCNKIGHFASRCLKRMSKYDSDNWKPNPKYQLKYKKNKDMKCYYVVDDECDEFEQVNSGNGKYWVFIAIKEDDLKTIDLASCIEEKALTTKIEEKDEWVVDSGFSHHMTSDKRKLVRMEKYDGGIVRFGDKKSCVICGRGLIYLDCKHNTNDVLYVEGLKNNLFSVFY